MKLFEPIKVRGLTLKNRVLMAPMGLGLGLRGRRARAFYAERAEGGVAAIITQGTPPDVFILDAAWGGQPGAAQAFAESCGVLAHDVHQAGGTIGIQLAYGAVAPAGMGQPGPSGQRADTPVSASSTTLTHKELQEVIARFTQAAVAVKRAGFDFVELHGAHSNLLRQFFSGASNQRTDEYGGSLENRMRLGREVVASVRKAVGDFPISFRFPAEEDIPGGITIAESQSYAQELERAGVDLLNVSTGERRGGSAGGPSPKAPYGTYVHLAANIKTKVRIPVAAVGRINTPEVAEAALAEGKADLVALGRQLIADPFWPQKVRAGQPYILCDSCGVHCRNIQTRPNLPPDASLCHQNPRAGKEAEIPRSSRA